MARRRGAKSLLNPFNLWRRNAIYKGLLGGDRTWLVIGAVVWGPKLVKRVLGRNEEIVATEKLRPGMALRIEPLPQTTRAERKIYRRSK
ncbi:MAG: hypothetical protein ABIR68_19325 [Ilumatobacteraceae bacterium]